MSETRKRLGRSAFAEFVGTLLLAATVVGSGAMAVRLTDDVGLQLLANSLATGAVLVALILTLGAVSADFNPVVTLVARVLGPLGTGAAAVLIAAQVIGCCVGVMVANVMFGRDAVEPSQHVRSGGDVLLAETVATFGLVLVIFGVLRSGRRSHLPYAVGAYITAAYWFTSSTGFANPAITISRALTDSFAGIAARSVPAFVAMQVLGGLLALAAVRVLYPHARQVAHELMSDQP